VSLYDNWDKYSKAGRLGMAGCQILADWKRERDSLRSQLTEAQGREAVLREALEDIKGFECDGSWLDEYQHGYMVGYNEAIKQVTEDVIDKALSTPSPAADIVQLEQGPWPQFVRDVKIKKALEKLPQELKKAVSDPNNYDCEELTFPPVWASDEQAEEIDEWINELLKFAGEMAEGIVNNALAALEKEGGSDG